MNAARLSFGRKAESPTLTEPGIELKCPRDRFSLGDRAPIWVYGCCRIGKDHLNVDKQELPAGIFITAIEIFQQRSVSANVVADYFVFEDDIIEEGGDYVLYFHFNLLESLNIPRAPFTFLLHASFFHYVSNVIPLEFAQ
jgi:hypothetical protein